METQGTRHLLPQPDADDQGRIERDAGPAPDGGSEPAIDAQPETAAPDARPTTPKTYAGCPAGDFPAYAATTFGPDGYIPKCLELAWGSSMTFTGDFKRFPMVGASTNIDASIPFTDYGSTITIIFRTEGNFGFYSPPLGTDDGRGMAGLVWVHR